MKRFFLITLFALLAALAGIQGAVRYALADRNGARFDSSDLTFYAWLSGSDLPVNEALLAGAKELLKGIYTYSPGKPDYLPSSYTALDRQATDYVVHASRPTVVSWKGGQGDSIEWRSSPGGSIRGWSGTVSAAGRISDKTTATQCFTDCSGFITSLFAYANSRHPTAFKSWMKGGSIPEAGCFDPEGGCRRPNPDNYHRLFTKNLEGFRNVSMERLAPGDLIACASTKNPPKATGHVMLVAAVAHSKDEPRSRLVVVIDETGSPHSMDTRHVERVSPRQKVGAGLGMGIVKLSSTDGELRFYWKVDSTKAEPGSIALGRAE